MELTSKSVGKVLKIFLFITIALNGIGLITSYFFAFQPVFFEQYLLTFDQFLSLFFTGIMIILNVLYLIWLFKVHKDFNKLDQSYPISPSGALARVLVPVYNIWGLWNVYSRMAVYLFPNTNSIELGKKLSKAIPFYYILLVVSRVLNQYLTRGTLSGVQNIEMVWLLSYAVDLVLTIVFLVMYRIVTSALQVLHDRKQTAQEIPAVELAN